MPVHQKLSKMSLFQTKAAAKGAAVPSSRCRSPSHQLALCFSVVAMSISGSSAFVPPKVSTRISWRSDRLASVPLHRLSAAETSKLPFGDNGFGPLGAFASTRDAGALDWSFVDAAYLITCPNADPESARLKGASAILSDLGLAAKVEIKEFDTDDEDRIRGCYTSHISVMKDAMNDIARKNRSMGRSSQNKGEWWQQLLPFPGSNGQAAGNSMESSQQAKILVIEDNIDVNGSLDKSGLEAIANFSSRPDEAWDMIHLSYIPYVPNLLVSKTDDPNMVKLSCGVGSALGTTAYIINESAMRQLIEEDEKRGYYAAIPDVMALRFPETRFASYPVPFLRAAKTPSLVNPQLDDLRSLLFQPGVVALTQSVLALSKLSSNNIFFATVASLLGISGVAGKITIDAGSQLMATGTYEGNIVLPVLSSLFSLLSLSIIAFGAAIAPKPPPTEDVENELI